jgi:hypothetical protein
MPDFFKNIGQSLFQGLRQDGVKATETPVESAAAPSLQADALKTTTNTTLKGSTTVVNSVFHFDAQHPQAQALIQHLGWDQPGYRSILQNDGTFLHYSTDGWKTTQDVPLQYMQDGNQAFLLKGVPDGTRIDYAIHAKLGRSYDNFYSLDAKQEAWLNQWGDGAQARTELNP